jgi:hypothetical protein
MGRMARATAAVIASALLPVTVAAQQPSARDLDSLRDSPAEQSRPASPPQDFGPPGRDAPAVSPSQSAFHEWLTEARRTGAWECGNYDEQFNICDSASSYAWVTESSGVIKTLEIQPLADVGLKDDWVIFSEMSHFYIKDDQLCEDLKSVEMNVMQGKHSELLDFYQKVIGDPELKAVRLAGNEMCESFDKRGDRLFATTLIDGKRVADQKDSSIQFFSSEPDLCSHASTAPSGRRCALPPASRDSPHLADPH